ncbi:MAG: exosortase C-terminal domain/associated protein EpsI [Sphingomonas sp.]
MTVSRRDAVFGAACVAALGASEYLRPRNRVVLLAKGALLTNIIPARFGEWAMGGGGDIVIPKIPGSLADRLYSDQIARNYLRAGSVPTDVMLLVAYGAAQNDSLQLHRPEVCYPAIGFPIVARQLALLQLVPGVAVPVVMLTARSGDRVEDIVYWTRLGEALPQTSDEQRLVRFEAAVSGIIPDGVLVRASAVRTGPQSAPLFGVLESFVRAMLLGMTQDNQRALLGTQIGQSLERANRPVG